MHLTNSNSVHNNQFAFNSFLIKSFSSGQQIEKGKEKIVYHYTSPNAFLSIVQNQKIRFTDIRYLNDKSEGIYFVKVLLDFLDKYRNEYPHFNEVVNNLLKENDFEKIRNLEVTNINYNESLSMRYREQRVFVFCTCAEADSLNMWNYYVNNGEYQGYNIGFRVEELIKTFDVPDEKHLDSFRVYYGKVLYLEKEHFAEIRRLAESIELYINLSLSRGDSDVKKAMAYEQIRLRNYIVSCGPFFKHPKFKSEEEFRVVLVIAEDSVPHGKEAQRYYGKNNKEITEEFSVKRGLIVPYLSVVIPSESIYRVTIAPMMEFDIAKKSIRELLEMEHIESVRICKSNIPIRF